MKRFLALLAAGIVAILGSTAFAAVPQLINFQGILKTPADTVVSDGSYFVTFTIYDAATGGNVKWTETQSIITTNGLFTVLLGSTAPLPDSVFYDSSRYLGMAVSPDPEMTPRQRLSSAGYSFVSSQWMSAGQNLFRLNGNVGIGTTNPSSPSGHSRTLALSSGGTGPSIGFENLGTGGQFFEVGSTADGGGTNPRLQVSKGSTVLTAFLGSGNIGIGTANPTSPFGFSKTLTLESGSFGPSIGFNNTGTGGQFFEIGSTADGGGANPRLDVLRSGLSTAIVTFAGNGNVGIGTSNPGDLLQVGSSSIRGVVSIVGSTTVQPVLGLTDSRTNGKTWGLYSGNPALGDFSINDSESASFPFVIKQGSGNVGIGTTSPSSKLEVDGDLKVSGNIIGSTSWTAFPFAAGYDNYEDVHGGGYQTVQYRKIGDIVYIRGTIHKADHAAIGHGATIGTLPVGFRPPGVVSFPTYQYSLQILPSGVVLSYFNTVAEEQFLDGIFFSTSP